MRKFIQHFIFSALFLSGLLLPLTIQAEETASTATSSANQPQHSRWLYGFFPDLWQDYKNHYSGVRLMQLGLLIGAAAPLANTHADREMFDYYQDHIRSDATDDLANIFEPIGRREIAFMTLPGYALGLFLSEAGREYVFFDKLGEWSSRSLRTFAVGMPQQALFTEMLGGERPEDNGSSHWRFFPGDGRGVSGHSFAGAVPFISAAKMADSYWLKTPLYALSTMTALSRLNDEKHFPSQILLGWGLAYLAATSVDETIHGKHRRFVFMPATTETGAMMLAATYYFE